ncbi:MAG: FecR domain-containing protein [Proteobacteria bacterium]|nr:FecR domain-containing protein [Pseudomonadota bacterium]
MVRFRGFWRRVVHGDTTLLRRALVSRPLSPSAMRRIRAGVEAAWRETHPPARARRAWLAPAAAWGAAAATAAIAIGWGLLWNAGHDAAPVVGRVVRVLDGGAERRSGWFHHQQLRTGDLVRSADQLATRGGSIAIVLTAGPALRLAQDTRLRLADRGGEDVELETGRLYLDVPVGTARSAAVRVVTREGTIEHVGTAYEARVTGDSLRVRVRAGRVRFTPAAGGGQGQVLVEAGTEIIVEPGLPVARYPIATFGETWRWTDDLSPAFDPEGRSVMDFLQWFSRELVLQLEFIDAPARQTAARSQLRGSMRLAATLQSLDAVLASTTLAYEVRDGAIRIHSGR